MLSNEIILLVAFFIAVGILLYNPSKNYGVPAALIFIGVGLFLGNDTDSSFAFHNPMQADLISQLALVIIIFVGGLHTNIKDIKRVFAEGLLLSNIGVFVTTFALGYFVSLVTPLGLLEGLLLGAIVSSTDAAAVFGVLESKNMKMKYNADKVLEFESATNDPMALILTLVFVEIIKMGATTAEIVYSDYLTFFVQQIFVGCGLSFFLFLMIKYILEKIEFVEEGLIPIFLLCALIVFLKVNDSLGGNALIGAYILGVMLNTVDYHYKDNTLHFFNSISWLAQSIMFLLLGLQIDPIELLDIIPLAILPALFLFLIARPLGVFASYIPIRQSYRKKLFISWSGLKGATPIVFALIPLIENLPNAVLIFYIVSFIVFLSLLIHPFSMEWVAKKTKVLR
ncbi:potassium/proton antiporter [Flammeovirga aprica]|uniref:Potassium/proton antiporter n=1 Tax=Flammeovirga aprica JL-4 TaxID=694437 RepID=A0A7X9XCZ6_9BACT|nr:potassium/proton antiporter [Flammeovirga aprica]NME72327.1 potassium/proton antiporter [Flammeovirga aprica JL-4]